MAIGVYFRPTSLNAEQYDDVIRRLERAGAGTPTGRAYHVCFGAGNELQVFEIWNSREDLDSFGATLMPILGEVGLDPGQPMVEPVHNTIG